MESEDIPSKSKRAEEQPDLARLLNQAEEKCRSCKPLTPLQCLTTCDSWKLKNELRKLYEKIVKLDFRKNLLNTLKNKRRLRILNIVSITPRTIDRLQQELDEIGYSHSQTTIISEYVDPLIDAGLIDQSQDIYYATALGVKLDRMIGNSINFEDSFPPHSECHEEATLCTLRIKPKTFREIENIIPTKSASRVLSRLLETGLVEDNEEKNYVFYHRTRRDQRKTQYSQTERRIYDSIPPEGISAGKLAQTVGISMRRTYKYLRRLKGKKMIFTRKKPRTYALTEKGRETAVILERIGGLVTEGLVASEQATQNNMACKPRLSETLQTQAGIVASKSVELKILAQV